MVRNARSQPASATPQRGVELEAVHDLDSALEQEVLGAQVPMAVADAAGAARASRSPRRAAKNASGEAGERGGPAREVTIGREREQRVRVLRERGVRARRSHPHASRQRPRRAWNSASRAADRLELAAADAAARHEGSERRSLVEAAHLDHVVDGIRGRPTGASAAPPSGVARTARTPRYRSGARRRLSRTSSSHIARRRSGVP